MDWEQRARAAEATVAVLKQKVRDLYDRGPDTAIHRQLARAHERDLENRQRRAVAEARSSELQKYSALLEQQVADRTRALRTIFDNVVSGFLLVDRECRVQEGFTRSCNALFGHEVSLWDPLDDLLGIAGTSEAVDLTLGVDQVFDDTLPDALAVDQIPSRFVVRGRVLHLEGRVVRREGRVEAILFTVTDVTALEAARREARAHAALVGLLSQRAAFLLFLGDTTAQLAAATQAIDDQAFARRVLHTVKGSASCFRLDDLAALVHTVEGQAHLAADDLRRVDDHLGAFLREHEDILGIRRDAADIRLTPEHLSALQRLLDPVDADGLLRWRSDLSLTPAGDLLGPHRALVERLAERLGREVTLALEGTEVLVDPGAVRPVLQALPHLLRNAVDHGIEAPWARTGKPAAGHVRVRVLDRGDRWTFEVSDDGRGVDWERLRVRAVEAGFLTAAEAAALSEEGLHALLFLDGLSSRAEADEISGRGVGMSAVAEAVRAVRGQIGVRSTLGAGTVVTVEVPKRGAAQAA